MIKVFFLRFKEKLFTFGNRKVLVLLLTSFSGLLFSVLALFAVVAVLSPQTLSKQISKLPFLTLINKDLGQVLQASTTNQIPVLSGEISFNLPSLFNEDVFIDANASVSGTLTAPNILYGIIAGDNITVTPGQTPTISAELDVIAGDGITIADSTITNDDPGSAQSIFKNITVGSDTIAAGSNTDTLEFSAGSNISFSTDTSNKKITISSSGFSPSGLTANGILYADSATSFVSLAPSTAGYVLTTNGSGSPPTWEVNSATTPTFDVIESGTNTIATMLVGTGASLDFTGSGTINASSLNGATFAAPGAIGGTTPGSGSFTTLLATGTTTFNGLTYTWPGSESNGYILQTNGSGTLSWIDSGSLPNADKWDTTNGVIYPKLTSTLDFLLGSTATASAKFSVTNINSGTPTASLSGGMYFTGSGELQTTNNQSLTLGGGDTGNIVLPDLSTGIVHVNASGVLSSSAIDLASGDITGILSIANGGTNKALTLSDGGIVWSDADSFEILSANANAGLALVSGGAGTPSWFTPTQGSLIFAGANGALSQDNSSLFFDDTNNRLGLGVNSNLAATLDIRATSGTLPIASVAGSTSFAGLVVDNTVGDLLTASSSGVTRFVISPTGNLQFTGGTSFLQTLTSSAAEEKTYNLPDFVAASADICLSSGNCAGVGGTGDVLGPGSATDNALVRFNGASGKSIQNSGVIIDDSNNITGVNSLTVAPASNITGLTLTGTNVTSGPLAYFNALNSSGTIFDISYGSSQTLTGSLIGQEIDLNDGQLTATNQDVTGQKITLPTVTNTNAAGTVDLLGLQVTFGSGAGINQNAAGATIYSALDVLLPALTQTAGSMTANGLAVTTPSSITTGGVANGLLISPTGIGAGTLNGVNIATISAAGNGNETAINIGTNWDTVLRVNGTPVINGQGVTLATGGGTGQSTYTIGDILYANSTSTLTKLPIGGSDGYVLQVSSGVPVWGTITGSSCSTCLINNPSSTATNTIAPTGQDTTGLIVRQTSTASPTNDIFQVTDSSGSTVYFRVDENGNVYPSSSIGNTLTLTPQTDTTALTLVGTNVTTANLQYINANNQEGNIFNLNYGASQTLSTSTPLNAIAVDLSTNVTATNANVTGTNLTLPGTTNTHTSGLKELTGVSVTAGGGINQNGAGGTTTFAAFDATIPALTQTQGTLNGYGLTVTTPSSITTGGTAAALNVSASGVGAGTLYGLNISGITAGSGIETALAIGSGWDTVLSVNGTVVIDSSGNLNVANATGILPVANGGSPFEQAAGAIFPRLPTQDLLIGGVSTASATFHVYGASPFQGTNPVASIAANTSFAGLVVDNTTGDLFTASASGLPRFVITNNGRVGINTTDTSLATLTVKSDGVRGFHFVNSSDNVSAGITNNGAMFLASSTTFGAVLNVSTGSTTGIGQRIRGVTGQTGDLLQLEDTNGLTLTRFNANGALQITNTLGTVPAASISGSTSFPALAVDNSGTGDLFTASSSGLNRFVINQGGNVGINTPNPEEWLAITADDTFKWSLALYSPNRDQAVGALWDGSNVTFEGWNQNFVVSSNAYFTEDVGFNNSDLTFVNSINSTGERLGIGTTTPLATLDIRSGPSLNGGTLAIASVSGQTSFASLTVDNSLGDLFTASSSGLPRFVIQQNGNVGIGTALPTEKLALVGGNFLQTIATGSARQAGVIKDGIGATDLNGATGIQVQGKYAYVASQNDSSFSIIDISNPASPTEVGVIKDGVGATDLNFASVVAISGKYAYVTATDDNAMSIIDISNPTNPTQVGVAKDGVNGITDLATAFGVYVSGKYAYVAGFSDDAFTIIDVSNPASPTQVGVIKDGVGATDLDGAAHVYVTGKYAYVTAQNDDALTIIDVSNPASPTQVGVIKDGVGATDLNSAGGVYVSGKYAYVTGGLDDALTVIDISDPYNPTQVGVAKDGVSGVTDLDGTRTVYVSGKYAYVTAQIDDSLTVIDISDPTTPTQVARLKHNEGATQLDSPHLVYVSGKYAYVTSDGSDSLTVVDIPGIDAPSATIGNIATNDITVTENATIGNNLYVSSGLNVGWGGILSNGAVAVNSGTASAALAVNSIAGGGDLFTASSSGINRFVIKENGNVGIGTANPSQALDVVGVINASSDITVNGTSVCLQSGTNCPSGNVNYWDLTSNVIHPGNTTRDLVIGGTSTSSATFRASGTTALNSMPAVDITKTANALVAGAQNLALRLFKNNATTGEAIGLGFSGSTDGNQIGAKILHLRTGSNSQGDLLFYTKGVTTSGDFTTEKLRITGAGTVGIGTATPSATLHITGNLADNSLAGTQATALVSGITSFASLTVDNSGSGDIFTASKSGTTQFVIDSNGYVGIGTNIPEAQFNIHGSTGNYAKMLLTQADVNHSVLFDPTETFSISSWSNTNGGGYLRGISDDASAQAFVVQGIIGVTDPTDTTAAMELRGYKSNGSNGITSLGSSETVLGILNGTSRLVTVLAGGNVGIGTSTSTPLGTLDVRGVSDTLAVASVSGQSNSFAAMVVDNRGTGDIFTASSSGLPRFVIANNGSVGIGTSNPAGETFSPFVAIRKDQNGSTELSVINKIALGNVNANAGINFEANDSGGFISAYPSDSGTSRRQDRFTIGTLSTASGINIEAWNTGQDIRFFSGGTTERMRLTDAGRFGIATTNPLATLDVRGNITDGGTVPIASVSGRTSFAALSVDNTLGDLFTASSSGLNRFVIKQDGNVGIGTTTPAAQLHSVVSSGPNIFRIDSATSQGEVFVDGTRLGVGTLSNHPMLLYTNDTSRLFITHNGNIGIGSTFSSTTPPNASLDLRANVATFPIASISGATNAGFASLVVDNSGSGDLFTASSSGLNRFVINNNGNVGIGTTSAVRALDIVVNSNITNAPTLRIAQQGSGDASLEFLDLSKNRFFAGMDADDSSAFKINSSTAAIGGSTEEVVIFLTSGSTWNVPDNWNNEDNTIEVIGGGGGGADGDSGGGGGGGGGAYASAANVSLTPSGSVSYVVGSGGSVGNDGGDTWFCDSTSDCASLAGNAVVAGAEGGSGASTITGGAGGSTGVGDTTNSGGTGGSTDGISNDGGAGGGGAAGPHGDGGDGGDGDDIAIDFGGGGGGGGANGGANGSNAVNNGGGDGGNNRLASGGGSGGGGDGSNGGGGGGGEDNGQPGGDGSTDAIWTQTSDSTPAGPGSGAGGGNSRNDSGTPGSYGGGGGGGGGESGLTGNGAAGTQGIIVITYTPKINNTFANALLSMTQTGALTLQNSSDSTTALQLKNASGTNLFTLGTTNTVPVASIGANTSFAGLVVDNSGTGDIFTASSSGLTRFRIANNGDTSIWIGTQIGSGGQRLCHSGSDGSNAFVRIADCNATSADYAEEYGTTDASIEAGDVVSIDPTRDAEEIMNNGVKGSKAWIVKTTKAYQSTTLGIVSTEPNDTIGRNFLPSENPRPVALNGRVPVKIASTSHPIKRGDMITASEIPGQAMKSTNAGVVIGKALEDWDPQDPKDKILVFVNISWHDPDIYLTDTGNINIFEASNSATPTFTLRDVFGRSITRTGVFNKAIVGSLNTGSIEVQNLSLGGQNLNDRLLGLESGFASSSATLTASLNSQFSSLISDLSSLNSRVASLEAQLQQFTVHGSQFTASSSAELSLDSLEVNGNILADSLNVLGYTTMNELSVTGSIRTGVLTIKGQSSGGASISTLNGDLRLQDEGFGGIDILDGKVTIDTSGNIETTGTITAKAVETNKLNIGTDSVLSASAGTVTIEAGDTTIDVTTTALTPDSLIFVSPDSPVLVGAKKKDTDTFTIKLQSPATTNIKVNWWLIN